MGCIDSGTSTPDRHMGHGIHWHASKCLQERSGRRGGPIPHHDGPFSLAVTCQHRSTVGYQARGRILHLTTATQLALLLLSNLVYRPPRPRPVCRIDISARVSLRFRHGTLLSSPTALLSRDTPCLPEILVLKPSPTVEPALSPVSARPHDQIPKR